MTFPTLRPLLAGPLLAATLGVAAVPAVAETLVGTNVDSRLVLALAVNPEAAAEWLPEGWVSAPFGDGPLAGANLLLTLIDQQVAYNAEGTLADPPTRLAAALVFTGQEASGDATRIFVSRIYSTDLAANPYGSTVGAEIGLQASLVDPAGQARQRRETWTVAPQDGGELTVTLGRAVGAASWGAGEAMPYSAVDPDFHRIYRFDQLSELVMSVPLGRDIAGELSLTTSIPELEPLFDNTERVVAIIAVPVYVREVFLP